MEIKTRNLNPNFTLVLPGPCQAKCEFCNWKREKNESKFIPMLKEILPQLPEVFKQISISGGEPTISPVYDETLRVIKEYKRYGTINKVVLTTNGFGLFDINVDGIDHINISRHHYDDEINREIFHTDKVPNEDQLLFINNQMNELGIDVNYNVVITEHINKEYSRILLNNFIDFVKKTNASSITFRNQYDDFTVSKIETSLLKTGFKPKHISSCPVCTSTEYIVNGIKVRFHRSKYEPTKSKFIKDDEVYELILQPNGNLTADWEGKKIILSNKKKKKKKKTGQVANLEPIYYGCNSYLLDNNDIYFSCGHSQYSGCGHSEGIGCHYSSC